MIQYLLTAPAYPLSAKPFMASKVVRHYEIYEPQQLPQLPAMTNGQNSIHRYVCDLDTLPWGKQEAEPCHHLNRLSGQTYLVPIYPVYTEYQFDVYNLNNPYLSATTGTTHPGMGRRDELNLRNEEEPQRRVNKSRVLFDCKERRFGHGKVNRFSVRRFEPKREGENSCIDHIFSQAPKSSDDKKGGTKEKEVNIGSGRNLDRRNASGGQVDGTEVDLHGKTSLMIRNIPNHFHRYNLLGILDNHCWEQNNQAQLHSDPILSEYDFLYLPMDFRRRANLGYAFVNFTNTVAASRFCKVFDKYDWNYERNKKICEISCAVLQGRKALSNQFKDSVFPCHTDDYLPVILAPPRNGANKSRLILVGKRANKTPTSSLRVHVNRHSVV